MNVSHYSPIVVKRDAFAVVGLKTVTTLKAAIEYGAIKRLEASLFQRSPEIINRVGKSKILVQIYPPSGHIGFHTSYTVLLGYPVENLATIPEGMTGYQVPAGDYARVTHVGDEAWISKTYSFIYRHWLPRRQRIPVSFDYEVWDTRYLPGQPRSEIDIFVPLHGNRGGKW
jgi:predicted transcriptional regulator YdeE